jgi:type III secretion protein S
MGLSIIYLAKQALVLSIIVCLPTVLMAAFIGIIFSIFQTLTQIQDQTLSFAIKLIFTMTTIYLTINWGAGQVYKFTLDIYQRSWW